MGVDPGHYKLLMEGWTLREKVRVMERGAQQVQPLPG